MIQNWRQVVPIYEYKCDDCSTQFELRCGFNDESELSCPECKGKMRRVLSAVPIIFKGPGFYVTDNRKNGSTPEVSRDNSCSAN